MLVRSLSFVFFIFTALSIYSCADDPIQPVQPVAVMEEAIYEGYMQNCSEPGHFGLYSYLLVAYPGNGQNFIDTIRVFLEKATRLQQQNRSADRRLLNMNFIPLWNNPPAWVSKVDLDNTDELDAAARWLAQNYDHKCARSLMSSISASGRNSIYIASSLTRLSTTSKSPMILAQKVNTGTGPSHLELIDEYFKKTWHPRQWTDHALSDVAKMLQLSLKDNDPADDMDIPVSDFLLEQDEVLVNTDDMENSHLNDPHLVVDTSAEEINKADQQSPNKGGVTPPSAADKTTQPAIKMDDKIITVILPN